MSEASPHAFDLPPHATGTEPTSPSTEAAPPVNTTRSDDSERSMREVPVAEVALELVAPSTPEPTLDSDRLAAVVTSIVRRHFTDGGQFDLTLHIVDDAQIRALNAEHRGKDTHTDVLSFPLYEPDSDFVLPPGERIQLGDVVISYPRAVEQADAYGHSVPRELAYLLAHGTLHLLGYDHETPSDRELMRQREEDALVPLGLTR